VLRFILRLAFEFHRRHAALSLPSINKRFPPGIDPGTIGLRGTLFNDPNGVITTPGFPNNYPENSSPRKIH